MLQRRGVLGEDTRRRIRDGIIRRMASLQSVKVKEESAPLSLLGLRLRTGDGKAAGAPSSGCSLSR